jgi:hypothetical protein
VGRCQFGVREHAWLGSTKYSRTLVGLAQTLVAAWRPSFCFWDSVRVLEACVLHDVTFVFFFLFCALLVSMETWPPQEVLHTDCVRTWQLETLGDRPVVCEGDHVIGPELGFEAITPDWEAEIDWDSGRWRILVVELVKGRYVMTGVLLHRRLVD